MTNEGPEGPERDMDERDYEEPKWPDKIPKWPHGTPVEWSVVRSGVDTYDDSQRLRIAIGHRLNRLGEIRLACLAEQFFDELYSENGTMASARKKLGAGKSLAFPDRWVKAMSALYGTGKDFDPATFWNNLEKPTRSAVLAQIIAARQPKGERKILPPTGQQIDQAKAWMDNKVSPQKLSDMERYLTDLFNGLAGSEKNLAAFAGSAALEDPTGIWLQKIRGIGPVLSATLLATFDPSKAKHVSSYWKFAGFAPGVFQGSKTGKEIRMDKLSEGELSPFNQRARVIVWRVVTSLIMSRNAHYRQVYDEAKAKYVGRPDIMGTDDDPKKGGRGHADTMAKRIVAKEFLKDFYLQHRVDHGFTVDGPYDPHSPNHVPYPAGVPMGTPSAAKGSTA